MRKSFHGEKKFSRLRSNRLRATAHMVGRLVRVGYLAIKGAHYGTETVRSGQKSLDVSHRSSQKICTDLRSGDTTSPNGCADVYLFALCFRDVSERAHREGRAQCPGPMSPNSPVFLPWKTVFRPRRRPCSRCKSLLDYRFALGPGSAAVRWSGCEGGL